EFDFQGARALVDQERKQANYRIHGGTTADDAGQAWRHAGGGLGNLTGEQHQGLFLGVAHGQFDHHFTGVLALSARAVGGFGAQQFDVHFAVRTPAAFDEHFLGLLDDGLADALGLGHGVDAGNQAAGGAAE